MSFSLKRTFQDFLSGNGQRWIGQKVIEDVGHSSAVDEHEMDSGRGKRKRFPSKRILEREQRVDIPVPPSLSGDQVVVKRDRSVVTWSNGYGNAGTPNSSEELKANVGPRPEDAARLSENENSPGRPSSTVHLSHVYVPGPDIARSAHIGWHPPSKRSSERNILNATRASKSEEYTYLELDQFAVYRPFATGPTSDAGQHPSRHSLELCSLDKLRSYRSGIDTLLFDGVVSFDEKKAFVQGVPFSVLSIDGYGDVDASDLAQSICLQSNETKDSRFWYRLGSPAPEYRRFYSPFKWLAQFARFFIAYLWNVSDVTIHHFRKSFYRWLLSASEDTNAPALKSWLDKANLTDFRTTVTANVGFLFGECYSLNDRDLMSQPVWSEVDPYAAKKAIPEHGEVAQKTVVTPYVFECFKRMYFAKHLRASAPRSDKVLQEVQKRKRALGLTPFKTSTRELARKSWEVIARPDTIPADQVRQGDVICLPADNSGRWRKSSAKQWYAYVQAVQDDGKDRRLDVLWMYEPSDTTIGKANYLYENELFLSDNCSCGSDALDPAQVTSKVEVEWRVTDPSNGSVLFVRQRFRTVHEDDTYDFVSLKDSDFACACVNTLTAFEECFSRHKPGDAVLYLRDGHLEPAKICDYDEPKRRVIVQPFLRKRTRDPCAAPNELVFGTDDDKVDIDSSSVIRASHIRVFPSSEAVCCPYDRQGSGDYWYIVDTPDQVSDSSPLLKQALDPASPPQTKPLVGLGIFCGGGNFDRGLEEGGAVKFKHTVDWATNALHSYRANVDDTSEVNFFLGSVNDYLLLAMRGSPKAAAIGIEVISAGSPCPGFSQLQSNRMSDSSLRNASMVASVVAFVDLYSPKYLLLENVTRLAGGMGAGKDENVFSAIIAALVGLGYQVQQFLMDSWSYGSCQSRSRIFIVATAPGVEPLLPPPHTHSRPDHKLAHSLGQSSNGLSFGIRQNFYTPYQPITIEEALKDLPNVTDGQVGVVPKAPDHRIPTNMSLEIRSLLTAIPAFPRGMGYIQAYNEGRLQGRHKNRYNFLSKLQQNPTSSKSYSRLYSGGLFPTVTTAMRVACAHGGQLVHWEQHRCCTVLELRRAQGFLNHEVIVGTPAQQVIIVGNSVDRRVAFALGQSLRESWLKSAHVVRPSPQAAVSEVDSEVANANYATETEPLRPTGMSASIGTKGFPDLVEDSLSDTSTDSAIESDEELETSIPTVRPNSPTVIIPQQNHVSVPDTRGTSPRSSTAHTDGGSSMSDNINVANGWEMARRGMQNADDAV
ncbi:hypothetical protein MBLNU230_g0858t1 [Neophaeotheca triangularis]